MNTHKMKRKLIFKLSGSPNFFTGETGYNYWEKHLIPIYRFIKNILGNISLMKQNSITYYSDDKLTKDDINHTLTKKELEKSRDNAQNTCIYGSNAYYAIVATKVGNIPFPLLWKINKVKTVRKGNHKEKNY